SAVATDMGFVGNGSRLTSLNASEIETGTIADARIPTNIVRQTAAINTGNGLTGGGNLSANRTLSVVSGNGTTVNSTGIHVGAGNGISVNTTAVAVVSGNGTTVNSTGIHVGAGNGISV